MTKSCPKCDCSEHESCLNEFEGQIQCRKCLLYNPFYYGTFSCNCGEWEEEGLKKLIDEGCMIPKCQICLKAINTDVTCLSHSKYLENKGCPENQQRFKDQLEELITWFLNRDQENFMQENDCFVEARKKFIEKWSPK